MLLQVKASAGSGKTHALTQRFLMLVRRSTKDLPLACADSLDKGYAVPEILAVTFTNKAAAEMRERVLGALKTMALGLDGTDADSRRKARDELEALLIFAQRLNIRTIDSLLFLLTRVFALDLGLRPDFEPAFDDTAILADLYDRLAATLPEDPTLARLFSEAAGALLQHTKGFLPTEPFREQLLTVAARLLTEPMGETADPETLRLGLERRLGALKNAAEAILLAMDSAGIAGSAHFLTFLRKCRDSGQTSAPPRSAFESKAELAECVLKASKDKVTPELDRLYETLKAAHATCRREVPVVRSAMGLSPFLVLARRLSEDVPAYLTQMRVLPQSLWTRLVAGRLAGDFGVPDAWCRMGAGLAHILIDEFQDTAQSQWEVLRLLAVECLARGGSLYLVGDVKQAIYGWRGGDAALFDQAPADPDLTSIADVTRQTLPINWRSAKSIVETNNRFFAPLADPEKARQVAAELLGPELGAAVPELSQSLVRAFTDAAQKLAPGRAGPEGHVRVTALPADSTGEYETAARATLIQLLHDELLPRHGPEGVAILTRSNPQAALVASWCIDSGIPVVTENSLRLAEHPLIRQLAAMLAFLDYPPDSLSFWSFVSGQELFGDLSGISRADMAEWVAGLPFRGSLSLAFRDRWPEIWQRYIRPYLRQTGLATPYDLLREIISGYRLLERRPADEAFLRRFLEIAYLAESKGMASISAFLDFWRDLGADEKVPQPENFEAVRVMTIHKAKGLQFPAVVVPFHHFHTRITDPELVEAALPEGTVLVPDQPGLGAPYALRRARELGEQAHLLYVAWTRPELELHAFVPGHGKLRTEACYPLPRALGILFAAFGHDPADGTPIRIGALPETARQAAPVCPAPPVPEPVPEQAPPPMSWLPRLKVYRNNARDIRDAMRFTEKRRGELAHLAAATFVQTGFDATDPAPAARRAVGLTLGGERLEPGLRHTLTEDFVAMLIWLAGLPECRTPLADGLCERDLLDETGEVRRPDLYHVGPDATVVIDFKTGQERPEHIAQVHDYLVLTRQLPGRASLPAHGYLVYLDRRECRPVEIA